MAKTIEEINKKIRDGNAVILTAEEIISYADENGIKKTAADIDVVTTATFSPMCSTGAFLNFGHADPPIRMTKVWLNDVPAYAGLAAVDAYIGATELSETEGMAYGGAHVIEDLIAGKNIKLHATAYPTDCYPRREINTFINKDTINQAYLFNPRNSYQNYSVATNSSSKTIYTYMGKLLPNFGNATFSSAGQLSPMLNDPYYRTIGIGTKIFFGGGTGYVAWHGTQHSPEVERMANGVPAGGAGTLALIGDLKQMSLKFIKAAVFTGYGVTMFVGIGIPIPVIDEEMVEYLKVRDEDIYANIYDYSVQRRNKPEYGRVNYKELRSGRITINRREVPTGSLSSYQKAREIAAILKDWIKKGSFTLTQPVASLPMQGITKPLNIVSEDQL
jgi:uncharacterized protein (DUF39 family)